MAGHSGSTRNKRQKEQARQEKQRAKAARRQQRKLEKQNPSEEEVFTPDAISDATSSEPQPETPSSD